jgi:hypothetical protein
VRRAAISGLRACPGVETEAAQRGELGLDWLTQLLQLDDTLPTLAADPDTIRDAIKAVGGDTQVTVERRQP